MKKIVEQEMALKTSGLPVDENLSPTNIVHSLTSSVTVFRETPFRSLLPITEKILS